MSVNTTHPIGYPYRESFPTEVPQKAAQTLILTTACYLAVEVSLPAACLGGLIATLATLVEAATRPIIRSFFQEQILVPSCIQGFLNSVIACNLAGFLSPQTRIAQAALAFTPFRFLWWTIFNRQFYEKNVAVVSIF